MKTIPNISKINIKLTLILSVLVILWSLESNASVYGVLKGKVLDTDGKPAIGASVKVLGTTRGAKVKADGEFTIVNILAGTYEMTITYTGTQEIKRTVNIVADSTTFTGIIKLKVGVVGDEIIELNDKKVEDYHFAKYRVTICPVSKPVNSEKENGIYTVNKQKVYSTNELVATIACGSFDYSRMRIVQLDLFKEELILIKYTNDLRRKRLNNNYEFITFDKFNNKNYFDTFNNYSLELNEVEVFNPPTAKFGIMENLSFNAGIVQ